MDATENNRPTGGFTADEHGSRASILSSNPWLRGSEENISGVLVDILEPVTGHHLAPALPAAESSRSAQENLPSPDVQVEGEGSDHKSSPGTGDDPPRSTHATSQAPAQPSLSQEQSPRFPIAPQLDVPWNYLDEVTRNIYTPHYKWLNLFVENERVNDSGRLSCYEFCPIDRKMRLDIQADSLQVHQHWSNIHEFWCRPTDVRRCRLIVVEDLTSSLINTLGSALQLDPLVFIHHLRESGVDPPARRNTWINQPVDSYFNRQIFSLRWYRPVYNIFERPRKSKKESSEWSITPSLNSRVNLDSEEDANYASTNHMTTTQRRDESEEMEVDLWQPQPRRNKGYSRITNICRQEWLTGIKPVVADSENQLLVASSWLEKATVYLEHRDESDYVLILTDPLREISHENDSEGDQLANSNIGQAAEPTQQATGEGIDLAPIRESISHQKSQIVTTFYEPMSYRWTVRIPKWTWEFTQVIYPRGIRSTETDMLSWMTNSSLLVTRPIVGQEITLLTPHPLQALFMVVFLDTMTFVDSFDKCLEDIKTATSEESLLRRFSNNWITIVSKGQAELLAMRASVEEFSKQIFEQQQAFEEIQDLTAQVILKLKTIAMKTDKIYDFVRAEFAALESRKQLSESESVTRLTELAFIFIPISFVASTFSMQIQELQSPPPLTTFIFTSVIILLVAYTVRILIHSTLFSKTSQRVTQAIRSQESIRDGQPIPTRKIFRTCLTFVRYPIMSLYTVTLTHIVGVLWLWIARRSLDTGLKATITVLVLLGISASWTTTPKARKRLTKVVKDGWMDFMIPYKYRQAHSSRSSSEPN